jgi:hypothetical protein
VKTAVSIKSVPEEDIPEVIDFLDAQTRLEEFRARNPQLMDEYEALLNDYNTAREAADKAVRGREVNCGPWQQLTPTVTYSGEKLYSAVGREDFVRLGGIVRTVTEYVIDKDAIEAAISANKMPKEVVEVVRHVMRKYKQIPKGQLP